MKKTLVIILAVIMIMVPVYDISAVERDEIRSVKEDAGYYVNCYIEGNNMMSRAYTGTATAIFEIIKTETGEKCAMAICEYDYQYADGSWAQITRMTYRCYSNDGYSISNAYGAGTSMLSDYTMGYFYFDFTDEVLDITIVYRGNVYCDIYGELWSNFYRCESK